MNVLPAMQNVSDQPTPIKKPILVTGSHRSGTTWVGRMLAQAPLVVYIHEPFNVIAPPGRGVCNARFRDWFTYVTLTNESPYYRPLRRTMDLRYDLIAALASARSREELRRSVAEYRAFSGYRRRGCVPLIKDPIAFFSADWLTDRFDMTTIVLIRHPAAFVSSIVKLSWSHPFDHFLRQELLMREVLYPFEAQIRAFADNEQDAIDQAILLWRIFHYTVHQYQALHTDWVFLRHEDLSRDPLQGFRHLFERLSLPFTPGVEAAIQEYSSARNPRDPDGPTNSDRSLRRNSRENVGNWRHRLTAREIAKVHTEVEDTSRFFYTDDDW